MVNIDIQGEAVSKLEELTRRDAYLESSISKSDTEPIWDGEIRVYRKPRKKSGFSAESIGARIPIQVKGKTTEDILFPDTIMFNVKKKYLIGFSKDKGAIFFVVLINIHTLKNEVYYYEFLPIILRKAVNNLGEKKSKSFSFKKLVEEESELRHLLENFNSNSLKQISNVNYALSFEKAKLENGKIVFHYIPKKPIKSLPEFLSDLTSSNLSLPMYLKTNIGVEIPVDDLVEVESLVAYEKIDEPVAVNGTLFFENFSRQYSKKETRIQFGNSVIIVFQKQNKKTFDIKLIGNIGERIKGLDFIKELLTISKAYEDIERIKRVLEFQRKYEQVIHLLNLKDAYSCGNLSIEDERAIDVIYKGLVAKETCDNITKRSLTTFITFTVVDEQILLIAVARGDGHVLYRLEEMETIKFVHGEQENLMSVFLLLAFQNLKAVNLDFNVMEESIFRIERNFRINELLLEDYINFTLHLIRVYDEDRGKARPLMLAERLSQLLMDYEKNNINIINYLQIKKRLLSGEKFKEIFSRYPIVPNNLEEKICIKLLSDKSIVRELRTLKNQSEDQYKKFISYPIYNLGNNEKFGPKTKRPNKNL